MLSACPGATPTLSRPPLRALQELGVVSHSLFCAGTGPCTCMVWGQAQGGGRAVPSRCLWMLGYSTQCSQAAFLTSSNSERKQELDFCHALDGGSQPLAHPNVAQVPVPARGTNPGPVAPPGAAPVPSSPVLGACCDSGCCSGTPEQWQDEDLSLIRALLLSPSPSPPTPLPVPGMIDAPHPARLQRAHCHAEDVVNSLWYFMANCGRLGVFCSSKSS